MRQMARPNFSKLKDIPTTPLYEFAHGLSYMNYEYGDLKASAAKVKQTEK
jgi:beta-glucosidase